MEWQRYPHLSSGLQDSQGKDVQGHGIFNCAEIMDRESLVSEAFGSPSFLFYTVFTALCFTYGVLRLKNSKSKLPPGPRGLPLLGNFLQIVKDPHLQFFKWAKTYGKMYTIGLVNRKALIINDAKFVKELLGTIEATGKFKSDTLLLLSKGPYGLVNAEGSEWSDQRQFCVRSLRHLGYGKSSSMDPYILEAANELCEWISKTSKSDARGIVDLSRALCQSTANTLWALVAGEKFKLDDRESGNMWSYWLESVNKSVKTGLAFFPWLKYVAPNLSGYVNLQKSNEAVHAFIERKIEEHKKTYVEGQTRDLIDMYIEHTNMVNASGNWKSPFFGEVGFKNFVATVAEMFLGGGETMDISMRWAVIFLSHNGKVQRKMQGEIDEVIGRERDPSLADKARMPYSEAVILEAFRLASIVPIGVPHELLGDISFHGWSLPKGLILMPNMYHIHHDAEVWGDPEEFRPERFLSDEGQKLRDNLLPFQAGKRQCIGQPLAKDVLFLFLVKLFQQFSFYPDSSVSKEDYYRADMGLSLVPGCTKFLITPRKNIP